MEPQRYVLDFQDPINYLAMAFLKILLPCHWIYTFGVGNQIYCWTTWINALTD